MSSPVRENSETLPLPSDELHADAVPFPLGGEVGGIEHREVLLLVDRVGQHQRMEARGVIDVGALALPSSQAKSSV